LALGVIYLDFLIIQERESIDIVWKNIDILLFSKHFTKPKDTKEAALKKCFEPCSHEPFTHDFLVAGGLAKGTPCHGCAAIRL